MNRLSQEKREGIIHSLTECMSQRACERIFKVSNKTVAKLANDVGDMAIGHISQTKGLEARRIQADELWSFVKVKQKNVPRQKVQQLGVGSVWTYLAICDETKFIIDYALGDRKLADARAFMKSVKAKLAVDKAGQLSPRPEIVTDGLKAYEEAGEIAFGNEADRAMLVKQYSNTSEDGEPTPASRYTGAERRIISGAMPEEAISTYAIERFNLTLRMLNKRFTRKTNAFSKTLRNHERALALTIMYYNYCWLPQPKTKVSDETGEVFSEKRLTPAMEIGITDRVWEVADLLELTDAHLASVKSSQNPSGTDLVHVSDATADREPYWVYSSNLHHTSKVHKADCVNCNNGQGRTGGKAKTGVWHGCATLEDAMRLAENLYPENNAICRMCLGSYRKSGYRGPRGPRKPPRRGVLLN